MNLTTNISISTSEILKLEKSVKFVVLEELQKKVRSAIPSIEWAMRAEISKRINNSNVIRDLLYGKLRLQLGLTEEEATSISQLIPDAIAKTAKLSLYKYNNSLDIFAQLISNGYEELLSLPQAEYIQTHTTGGEKSIPWLSWLLKKGDAIIIGGFRVKYTPGNSNSRSGGAVMLSPGTGFRISPEYAGTEEDNFITRSLDGINDFLYKQIIRYL